MEITTFPAVITCPGKYIITQDVSFSSTSNTIENLITVNACNVTIDLMGHSLSITEQYRYKNRWLNLIYSKHSICVNNGTLGRCSGYGIKCDKDIHCKNLTFTMYELGALVSDSYISLEGCTILSPNGTNTLYPYDYSRRLINVAYDIISNQSYVLPIIAIGELSQYMATLENLLDFVLEQYNRGIIDLRFFSETISYRLDNIIYAPKVKICNSTINILNIGTSRYSKEELRYNATNTIVLDVGYFPIQYVTSVEIPELSNVVWYSGYLVNTYNLPYYRIPTEVLDGIKNLNINIPIGYSNANLITNIILILTNDIKLYNSTIITPDIPIIITNSRYVRCIDCTITTTLQISSSKSVRITGSTISTLKIISVDCIELCNNNITLLIMNNVGPNISIKGK